MIIKTKPAFGPIKKLLRSIKNISKHLKLFKIKRKNPNYHILQIRKEVLQIKKHRKILNVWLDRLEKVLNENKKEA